MESIIKRKSIAAKKRLEVLTRDHYTCCLCGRSPALYPELSIDVVKLEIDHIIPHSKGGPDSIENYQTLCQLCNRGKGDNEKFNIQIKDKIDLLLNQINPEILRIINELNEVKVVANETDYLELLRLNGLSNTYVIKAIPNTIIGYHAGYNMGLYTLVDNNGTKANFSIKVKE